MKVLVEIDTLDIFNRTASYKEDSEIVEEMLDRLRDEVLVSAVISRGLADDVWDELPTEKQEEIIDTYAEDFGYYKKED